MAKKPIAYQPSEMFADADLVDRIFDYILAEIPELRKAVAALKPQVRAEFNGERCYITTNTPSERQQLVQQVLSQFNGRNATEVARRLQISRATVYRIIKQPGGVKNSLKFAELETPKSLTCTDHGPDPNRSRQP